jgi:hypothetical protein
VDSAAYLWVFAAKSFHNGLIIAKVGCDEKGEKESGKTEIRVRSRYTRCARPAAPESEDVFGSHTPGAALAPAFAMLRRGKRSTRGYYLAPLWGFEWMRSRALGKSTAAETVCQMA